MKKLYMVFACLWVLLVPHNLMAQNLISNPSFENIRPNLLPCPTVNYPTGGNTFNGQEWESRPFVNLSSSTTFATADYYNTCGTGGWGSTYPDLQTPRSGNAISGIVARMYGSVDYSEYLFQTLSSPLTVGTTYNIEFYVSLGEKGDFATSGVNSLGMYLTNDLSVINQVKPAPISANYFDLTPQIPNQFPALSNYTNTNGWTKISGTFTPQTSGIKYLLIGAFRSSLAASYYLIDDVSITAVPCLTPPTPTNILITNLSIVNAPSGCVQRGYRFRFDAGSYPNVSLDGGYEWIIPSGWTYVVGQGSRFLDLGLPVSGPYSPVIQVRLKNSCGSTGSYFVKQINTCGGSFSLQASPNPADQDISVTAIAQGGEMEATEPVTDVQAVMIEADIRLVDAYNQTLWKGKMKKGKAVVPTAKIPNGMYYLIADEKHSVAKQILIRH